jgi:hypothetical protein
VQQLEKKHSNKPLEMRGFFVHKKGKMIRKPHFLEELNMNTKKTLNRIGLLATFSWMIWIIVEVLFGHGISHYIGGIFFGIGGISLYYLLIFFYGRSRKVFLSSLFVLAATSFVLLFMTLLSSGNGGH